MVLCDSELKWLYDVTSEQAERSHILDLPEVKGQILGKISNCISWNSYVVSTWNFHNWFFLTKEVRSWCYSSISASISNSSFWSLKSVGIISRYIPTKMKFRWSNHLYVNQNDLKLFFVIFVFKISLPEVCDLAKNWYTLLLVSKSLIGAHLQN